MEAGARMTHAAWLDYAVLRGHMFQRRHKPTK